MLFIKYYRRYWPFFSGEALFESVFDCTAYIVGWVISGLSNLKVCQRRRSLGSPLKRISPFSDTKTTVGNEETRINDPNEDFSVSTSQKPVFAPALLLRKSSPARLASLVPLKRREATGIFFR